MCARSIWPGRKASDSVKALPVLFPFYIDVLSGAHLPSVAQELAKQELQAVMACESQRILVGCFSCLYRTSRGRAEPAIDRELAPLVQGPWGSATTIFLAGAMASFAGLHLGASAWAVETVLATEPLWLASWGLPPSILFTLILCITLIDGLPTASVEQRPAWEEKLAFYTARLGLWAESCPETFLHMRLLVEAGRARHAGEHDKAAASTTKPLRMPAKTASSRAKPSVCASPASIA